MLSAISSPTNMGISYHSPFKSAWICEGVCPRDSSFSAGEVVAVVV